MVCDQHLITSHHRRNPSDRWQPQRGSGIRLIEDSTGCRWSPGHPFGATDSTGEPFSTSANGSSDADNTVVRTQDLEIWRRFAKS
jgi:hypothetical protein